MRINPRYFRTTEAPVLNADPSMAKMELGWEPHIRFRELVRVMVDAVMRAFGLDPAGEGDRLLEETFPVSLWKKE